MNVNKIDNKLFNKTYALDDCKKQECIIHSYDYKRLKNILLHKKVDIDVKQKKQGGSYESPFFFLYLYEMY